MEKKGEGTVLATLYTTKNRLCCAVGDNKSATATRGERGMPCFRGELGSRKPRGGILHISRPKDILLPSSVFCGTFRNQISTGKKPILERKRRFSEEKKDLFLRPAPNRNAGGLQPVRVKKKGKPLKREGREKKRREGGDG